MSPEQRLIDTGIVEIYAADMDPLTQRSARLYRWVPFSECTTNRPGYTDAGLVARVAVPAGSTFGLTHEGNAELVLPGFDAGLSAEDLLAVARKRHHDGPRLVA